VVGSPVLLVMGAGIPSMSGFVAEFLIFRGSFSVSGADAAVYVGHRLNRCLFSNIAQSRLFGRLSFSSRSPRAVVVRTASLLC